MFEDKGNDFWLRQTPAPHPEALAEYRNRMGHLKLADIAAMDAEQLDAFEARLHKLADDMGVDYNNLPGVAQANAAIAEMNAPDADIPLMGNRRISALFGTEVIDSNL